MARGLRSSAWVAPLPLLLLLLWWEPVDGGGMEANRRDEARWPRAPGEPPGDEDRDEPELDDELAEWDELQLDLDEDLEPRPLLCSESDKPAVTALDLTVPRLCNH